MRTVSPMAMYCQMAKGESPVVVHGVSIIDVSFTASITPLCDERSLLSKLISYRDKKTSPSNPTPIVLGKWQGGERSLVFDVMLLLDGLILSVNRHQKRVSSSAL